MKNEIYNKAIMALQLILITVTLNACSSYDDPDIKFKGKVDSDFMTSLSRGEISMTFDLTDHKVYEMDYHDYISGKGNWEDIDDIDGIVGPMVTDFTGNLTVINGKTFSPLRMTDAGTSQPSILTIPWKRYCKETDCDETIYINNPFTYDSNSQTVTIGQHTYSCSGNSKTNKVEYQIEKAENGEITLSNVSTYQKQERGEYVPYCVRKEYLFYKKTALKQIETNNCYDSITDALLSIVRLMRNKYGDTPYWSMGYIDNIQYQMIIDLAQVEKNIQEGTYENEGDAIRPDPEKYPDYYKK